jgi:hypothetical protein
MTRVRLRLFADQWLLEKTTTDVVGPASRGAADGGAGLDLLRGAAEADICLGRTLGDVERGRDKEKGEKEGWLSESVLHRVLLRRRHAQFTIYLAREGQGSVLGR